MDLCRRSIELTTILHLTATWYKIVPDNPSTRAKTLRLTRRIDVNDIIILGTGDQMGIVTMTADAKAVRAASAQGIDFNVYLHLPYSLKGS